MEILLIILFIYISFVLSNIFISSITSEEEYKVSIDSFFPFTYRYLLDLKKTSKLKMPTIIVTLLSSIIFSLIFGYRIHQIINVNYTVEEKFLYLLLHLIVYFGLLYLSVYDILTLSIPEKFLKSFLFTVVLFNLIVGGYTFLIYRNTGEVILNNITIGTFGNIIAAFILGGIVFFINKITHNKGIGDGDYYIMFLIGLALGIPLSFISFMATSVLGSIIAIAYGIYIKKFRNVLVPFVPLILIGYLTALVIGELFTVYFQNILLLIA